MSEQKYPVHYVCTKEEALKLIKQHKSSGCVIAVAVLEKIIPARHLALMFVFSLLIPGKGQVPHCVLSTRKKH